MITFWRYLRCPHHGGSCGGRTCCCADRHWHPIRAWRETDGYLVSSNVRSTVKALFRLLPVVGK